MSKFNEFMNKVGKAADKAANEGAKLADKAAAKVKIKAEEARLCEKYEELGRLCYENFEDATNLPENISASVEKIKEQIEKINILNAEYEEKCKKESN